MSDLDPSTVHEGARILVKTESGFWTIAGLRAACREAAERRASEIRYRDTAYTADTAKTSQTVKIPEINLPPEEAAQRCREIRMTLRGGGKAVGGSS